MMLRTLFACALPLIATAAATTACTANAEDEEVVATEQPIVGGVESAVGAWPGTVALYKGSTQVCGGALVAPEWVLTAAHCVSSGATGGFSKVVINRHKLSETSVGESITVKKAVRHPRYSGSNNDNDLALLQLSRPSTSPIAKLPTAEQLQGVVPQSMVVTVGWGRMSEGGQSSNVLREVAVPVIDNAKCRRYSGYSRVTANMICAGYEQGGRDSCQGDSGSPLFVKKDGKIFTVGLTSWGIGCARARAPGVYTRVGNYLAWLTQVSGGAIGGTTASVDGGATTADDGGTPPAPDAGTGSGSAFSPFEASGTVSRGEERAFSFDAPEGTYDVDLEGTGDADLYVNANEPATTTSWDCRPFIGGTSEHCEVTLTAPGTVHLMVRGYGSTESNFTVKAGTRQPAAE